MTVCGVWTVSVCCVWTVSVCCVTLPDASADFPRGCVPQIGAFFSFLFFSFLCPKLGRDVTGPRHDLHVELEVRDDWRAVAPLRGLHVHTPEPGQRRPARVFRTWALYWTVCFSRIACPRPPVGQGREKHGTIVSHTPCDERFLASVFIAR